MKISKKLNNFLSSGRIWLKLVPNDLLLFSEQRLLAHFPGFSLLPGKKLGKNSGKYEKWKFRKNWITFFLVVGFSWNRSQTISYCFLNNVCWLIFQVSPCFPGKNLGKIRENWEKWKFRKNWITFFLVVGFGWNQSQTISYCFLNNVCWLIFQVSPCFPGKLGKNPGKLGKMKISKKLNSFLSSSRIWLKPVPNDLLLFSEQRLLAHFPGFSLLPGKNLGKIRENWEKWKFRKIE